MMLSVHHDEYHIIEALSLACTDIFPLVRCGTSLRRIRIYALNQQRRTP